ncbi:hypothetical protein R1sor_027492 [Riccia sorocarpa]|uniref:Uncharacterized protein n=1 Tax=Riccia sorocarpa TaxID=122646 RepID=A0ABD3GIL0_9MARC
MDVPTEERSESATLPDRQARFSPSLPRRRKTRVLSSSSGAARPFLTPVHSPIWLCLQRSPTCTPGGPPPHRALSSLRQSKRSAREQRILPVDPPSPTDLTFVTPAAEESPSTLPNRRCLPPSIRHIGRWKDTTAVGSIVGAAKLVEEHELPVLKPPLGRKVKGHGYATRSLFRDCSEPEPAHIAQPKNTRIGQVIA